VPSSLPHRVSFPPTVRGSRRLLIIAELTRPTTEENHHHHHQFLMPTIWRRRVRMNDLHCLRSFVKSTTFLNDSPIDFQASFYIIYSQSGSVFVFLSNLRVDVWNSVSCRK